MYFRTLTLSLLIHSCLFLWFSVQSKPHYFEIGPNDLIEVNYVSPEDAKQITMFAEAPDLEIMNRQATPFLSKQWQRVPKETIARKNGNTENRSPLAEVKVAKPKQQQEIVDRKDPSDIHDMVKPKSVDLSKLGGLYERSGESTSGERLFKNINLGDFNAINTDEYTFYSFHERINDRIRIRWINRIETTLSEFKKRGVIQNLRKGESTTTIEVRLDRNGNYVNSVVLQGSGIKSWDEAAVLAFQNGAPFVNPPQGIVDDSGYIRLQYRFSVMWDPKYISLIR